MNGESRQRSHSGNMSVTIPEILSHYSALGYSAGDVVSTGHRFRRRRLLGGRGFALPQARRRDRGGDREDRRAAEPRGLLGGGPRRAAARARAVVEPLADGVGLLGPLDELFPDMSEEDWAPYRERYPELVSGNEWRLPIMCFLVREGDGDDPRRHRSGAAGACGTDWMPEPESQEGLLRELAAPRGRARRDRHRPADVTSTSTTSAGTRRTTAAPPFRGRAISSMRMRSPPRGAEASARTSAAACSASRIASRR